MNRRSQILDFKEDATEFYPDMPLCTLKMELLRIVRHIENLAMFLLLHDCVINHRAYVRDPTQDRA